METKEFYSTYASKYAFCLNHHLALLVGFFYFSYAVINTESQTIPVNHLEDKELSK